MIVDFAKVFRNEKLESMHYGIACHLQGQELNKSWGDINFKSFTRSMIKPIQAKVCLDLINQEINNEFVAIAIASHNCETEQVNLVNKLATYFNLSEHQLKLGLEKNKKQVLQSKFDHNCSGKHLLMLSTCIGQNWDLDNYLAREHPLQEAIENEVKELLGLKSPLEIGIDGCGLPTYHLSIHEIALLFARLHERQDYQRIFEVMNQYPFIIGGHKQIDSLIMQTYPGKFIAKGGAEGFMMLMKLDSQETLIIKIIDGSHRAKAVVARGFAEKLGWIEKNSIEIDNGSYNSQGLRVGEISFSL
ncbi:MAG: asparaginase [Candidatus Caenarcaniphilales bacterium]|nr:asparaginase [Candidatus Caenarcaniphilales bacterium]